jgi:hypothetical protein
VASVTYAADRNAFSVWASRGAAALRLRAAGVPSTPRQEVEKDLGEVHGDHVEPERRLRRDDDEQDLVDAEAERVGQRPDPGPHAERDRFPKHAQVRPGEALASDGEEDQQDRPKRLRGRPDEGAERDRHPEERPMTTASSG